MARTYEGRRRSRTLYIGVGYQHGQQRTSLRNVEKREDVRRKVSIEMSCITLPVLAWSNSSSIFLTSSSSSFGAASASAPGAGEEGRVGAAEADAVDEPAWSLRRRAFVKTSPTMIERRLHEYRCQQIVSKGRKKSKDEPNANPPPNEETLARSE